MNPWIHPPASKHDRHGTRSKAVCRMPITQDLHALPCAGTTLVGRQAIREMVRKETKRKMRPFFLLWRERAKLDMWPSIGCVVPESFVCQLTPHQGQKCTKLTRPSAVDFSFRFSRLPPAHPCPWKQRPARADPVSPSVMLHETGDDKGRPDLSLCSTAFFAIVAVEASTQVSTTRPCRPIAFPRSRVRDQYRCVLRLRLFKWPMTFLLCDAAASTYPHHIERGERLSAM